MSYEPVYVLIALVLLGGAATFAYRAVRRARSERHRRDWDAQRARNAESWARRNDRPPH